MNTQNSQYRSINIIIKIDACMLIVTSRLSKFVPSPKYCIAVSINIDVEIEELCRAWQDTLQSALRSEYDLMFR